jgi:hypothetical protein
MSTILVVSRSGSRSWRADDPLDVAAEFSLIEGVLMLRSFVVAFTLVGFVGLALIGAGCGSGDRSTPPVAGVALRALDSARGSVKDASRGYFQRMLITEGADPQSSFGADLSMLGLDGRKLQDMPVDAAYKAAHDAALLVEDLGTRRRLLLELFNDTEQ